MQSAAEPLRDVLRQVEVSLTHCTLHKFMIFSRFCSLKHCTSISLYRSAGPRLMCTPTWTESGTWARATFGGSWWSSWRRLWNGSRLCTRCMRGHRARGSLTRTRSDLESSLAPRSRSVTGRPMRTMRTWRSPLMRTDEAKLWEPDVTYGEFMELR